MKSKSIATVFSLAAMFVACGCNNQTERQAALPTEADYTWTTNEIAINSNVDVPRLLAGTASQFNMATDGQQREFTMTTPDGRHLIVSSEKLNGKDNDCWIVRLKDYPGAQRSEQSVEIQKKLQEAVKTGKYTSAFPQGV